MNRPLYDADFSACATVWPFDFLAESDWLRIPAMAVVATDGLRSCQPTMQVASSCRLSLSAEHLTGQDLVDARSQERLDPRSNNTKRRTT